MKKILIILPLLLILNLFVNIKNADAANNFCADPGCYWYGGGANVGPNNKYPYCSLPSQTCCYCPAAYGTPAYSTPGYSTPAYSTPTYSTTGTHFKDYNKDSQVSGSDIGVAGLPNTLVNNGTQDTNSQGGYWWYAMPDATWTINAGGSVCGWHYKDPSVTFTISGADRIINFPLWPNNPTNLILQRFDLKDSAGNDSARYDPGEYIYAYTSTNNSGANQPYSSDDVIKGAIHMDTTNTAVTSPIGTVTATYPDYFYFQRDLCWDAGAQYRTGSYLTGENLIDWQSVTKYKSSTPGTYTARAIIDYLNRVNEGGTTATEWTDNQLFENYNIRNYTVSGNVFLDTDGDGNKDVGESNYTGANASITESGTPVATSNASGTYSISSRGTGAKTWRVTPPSGYIVTGPSTYTINFSNGAYTITPNTGTLPQGPTSPGGASTNTTTTITNVNFGISATNTWIQTYGLNARFDRGLPMSAIPVTADASYGRYGMQPASTSAIPGVLISGSENISFPVSPTNFNYKAGGTSFPDLLNSSLFPLKTSYPYLMSKIGSQAVELSSAAGGCVDYTNCTLTPATFRPGIYKVTGADLRLNTYNFIRQTGEPATPKDYIFLIDGSLAVKSVIKVADSRTLLFSVKNDIAIQVNVGRAPVAYTAADISQRASNLSGIEGFYVAGDDVRLNSRGPCPQATADVQLIVDGALIANAIHGDGFLDNQRSLCATNNIYPTLVVRPRTDLILNSPTTYQQNPFTWKEVAP